MMILHQHASTAQFYVSQKNTQEIDALRGEKFIFNGAYFKTKFSFFSCSARTVFYELL